MVCSLSPKSCLSMSAQGDYTFKLEGTEKNLSKTSYDLNLKGRQKGFYFNSSAGLEIDLNEKKLDIKNSRLSIYNKSDNLQVGNLSFGVGQLVEPDLSLLGVSFEHTKKSNAKTVKYISFAGKSTDSPVAGVKIKTEYGSNTSYGLFLLNKTVTQTVGLNFSRPVHKFSLLEGECYMENMNQWGLLLKNSIDYKKTTLQTEYSIIDKVGAFKLVSLYKTEKLNTEGEYSITNQNTLWKLKSDFKTKNFFTGGYISNNTGTNTSSLFYNGYIGYNFKFWENLTPSLFYNHSYSSMSALDSENTTNGISLGTTYIKSPFSISTPISLEQGKKQTQTSIKNELIFKRGIGLRYVFYGFRPWVNFNLSTTENITGTSSQTESNSISYGISRNFGRNLSFSYNCYQTKDKSESSINNRVTKYLTASYKFPKIPVNFETRFSWIDKNKPTSYLSIAYRKGDKKDSLVKNQDEEIEYIRQRPVRFGTMTNEITSLSKEFPTQDKLFKLGRINIMVFKDGDFDGKFGEKDIPIKDIKVKLNKVQSITNEFGKALFADIPVGSYTFSIDLSVLPIGLACSTKADEVIKINEGEDIYLNFPITQTGKISGGVFIDKNRNGIWDEQEKGAEDILIYADDMPNYTAINGKYRFTNLVPGTVKIKVDKKSLPKNFEMTTKDSFEVKLLPEQEIKDINFGIAQIETEIEFE